MFPLEHRPAEAYNFRQAYELRGALNVKLMEDLISFCWKRSPAGGAIWSGEESGCHRPKINTGQLFNFILSDTKSGSFYKLVCNV